jgi:hypothetical protein
MVVIGRKEGVGLATKNWDANRYTKPLVVLAAKRSSFDEGEALPQFVEKRGNDGKRGKI